MLKRISCLGLALGGLLSVVGCLGGDEVVTGTASQNATGPAALTTDASSYNTTVPIVVSWSGMPTNSTDWIDIAPSGSPLTTVTRWVYTGGTASGTHSFEGPASGTYVIRGFENDSYTLDGESDPFTVGTTGAAALSFDTTSYFIDQNIVVSWSGLPGNAKDWITIAPVGSSDAVTTTWQYTGGGTSGSMTFTNGIWTSGYPSGSYTARAFINDTFTKVGEIATGVQMGATVTTDTSSYAQYGTITVNWTNLDGAANDWIALAPQGSDQSNVTIWKYTGGGNNGSVTFNPGLSSTGNYVARAFEKDNYILAGTSPTFAVTSAGAGVTVTTDASTYALGAPVTVTWAGMPTNNNDWIAIAPASSSDTTVTRWVYTHGVSNGSFTFEGPPTATTYVARAFLNDTYAKLAQSASFVVQ